MVVCAAGSMPGDLHKLWRTRDPDGYHLEYGYSCMGYEVAGGLGVKLAEPDREVIVMVGDGSWLMMSSEIATSIQEGARITVVLIDNHGFGSIGGLSRSLGSDGFGTAGTRVSVDLVAECGSLGAIATRAETLDELTAALADARSADRTTVIVIECDPARGVGSYESWWDVPVAEVSEMPAVQQARADYERVARRAAAVPGRFVVSERRADRRGRGGDDRAGRTPAQPRVAGRPVPAGGRGRPVGACARWRWPSVTGSSPWRRCPTCSSLGLDALLVAMPDPLHAGTVLAGLDAGLHVFCEKPLCFTEREAAEIIERRDRDGLVVQVGYMKRFDPNYEAALDLLPEGGEGLRYISVEVSDPDSWPFVAHRPLLRADDVPAALVEDARVLQRAQVAEALGVTVDGAHLRGYADPLMSGVIHTINAVHGMLDRMGIGVGDVVGGQIWSGGEGCRRHGVAAGRRRGLAPRPGARARHRAGTASATCCTSTTGDRAAVPGALPEQPADRPVGAPLAGAAAGHDARAGRLRGGVRARAGGVLARSAVTGAEPVRNTVEDGDPRRAAADRRWPAARSGRPHERPPSLGPAGACARPAQLGPRALSRARPSTTATRCRRCSRSAGWSSIDAGITRLKVRVASALAPAATMVLLDAEYAAAQALAAGAVPGSDRRWPSRWRRWATATSPSWR